MTQALVCMQLLGGCVDFGEKWARVAPTPFKKIFFEITSYLLKSFWNSTENNHTLYPDSSVVHLVFH